MAGLNPAGGASASARSTKLPSDRERGTLPPHVTAKRDGRHGNDEQPLFPQCWRASVSPRRIAAFRAAIPGWRRIAGASEIGRARVLGTGRFSGENSVRVDEGGFPISKTN